MAKMNNVTEIINISISKDVLEKLDRLASNYGLKRSKCLSLLIEQAIEPKNIPLPREEFIKGLKDSLRVSDMRLGVSDRIQETQDED
ncbi:MAG: hypothetical protein AMJ43_07965 [Coxiella sp. DG_40]|nr:MAG: hypothetical protein AMJ43_07965 [Coxiella sp. DG_40]